jgi:hypothetical protein
MCKCPHDTLLPEGRGEKNEKHNKTKEITKPRRRVTANTPALLAARQCFLSKCSGKIINVLLNMKNNGYSEYTLNFVSKALRFLSAHADLNSSPTMLACTLICALSQRAAQKRNIALCSSSYYITENQSTALLPCFP